MRYNRHHVTWGCCGLNLWSYQLQLQRANLCVCIDGEFKYESQSNPHSEPLVLLDSAALSQVSHLTPLICPSLQRCTKQARHNPSISASGEEGERHVRYIVLYSSSHATFSQHLTGVSSVFAPLFRFRGPCAHYPVRVLSSQCQLSWRTHCCLWNLLVTQSQHC